MGYPPSALSTKVGEVPRWCPLWPVDPPVSLRAPHVLVRSHLVKAGVLGLANSHSDLHFLFNLIQCEDWLVVRQWSRTCV